MQQLPTTPDTTLSLDSSTALPSQASSAFLQDRLFKRRKIRLGKGKNALNSKKGLKDTETPFLLFDPLLDKSPEKRERTRGEEKAVLEHKMRGRQSGGSPVCSGLFERKSLKGCQNRSIRSILPE